MTGRLQLTAAVKKNEIGVARVRVREAERHNHAGCVLDPDTLDRH